MTTPLQLSPAPLSGNPAVDRWMTTVYQVVNLLAADRAYESFVPVTGFTHTIAQNQGTCLVLPAGTLASGTITLPAKVADGFVQVIVSSAAVTSLTVAPSSGQSIVGTATFALAADVQVAFKWNAAAVKWYRLQ